MPSEHRAIGQLIAGIVLIALGVLFLMDRFFVWQFAGIFRMWWPLLLILWGGVRLATTSERRWTGPLVLLTLGVIFQVQNLNLFYWWHIDRLWPAILIAVGFGILLRRLSRQPNGEPPAQQIEAKS